LAAMGNATAACCVKREDAEAGTAQAHVRRPSPNRLNSWNSIPDAEEYLMFFECVEIDEEVESQVTKWTRVTSEGSDDSTRRTRLRKDLVPRRRLSPLADEGGSCKRSLALVPEEAKRCSGVSRVRRPNFLPESPEAPPKPLTAGTGETFTPVSSIIIEQEQHLDKLPLVRDSVLDFWRERLSSGDLDEVLAEKLEEGFPELDEWTNQETVLRMLRASCGNVKQATTMLTKAIASRVRRRSMFQTMLCNVVCDMRVIGRDSCHRPTIYFCCRSQNDPLREMIPQIFLAFEAASRLSHECGQVVLVADMCNFTARLNMDYSAFKDLTENFGTVYADRLNYILLIDFSFIAQSAWTLCKPLLTERTRKKINFVGEAKAREIVRERFEGPTCERILSAFDINRDPSSSQWERESHAQRTSICDVPLGSLRLTDEAG